MIESGTDSLTEYQHPGLEMKRVCCSQCGETLYNTNAMDWRVVSQLLISKCHDEQLPDELHSESHFFMAGGSLISMMICRSIIDTNYKKKEKGTEGFFINPSVPFLFTGNAKRLSCVQIFQSNPEGRSQKAIKRQGAVQS